MNILVDRGSTSGPTACLAGFSQLTIASGQPTTPLTVTEDAIPWTSPELLDPDEFGLEGSFPTKESDCYALGMVMYEVLSGQTPFAPEASSDVTQMVLERKRPGKPPGKEVGLLTDMWKVLEHCWKHQPEDRVNAKGVLQGLQGGSLLPRSTFGAGEDTETGSGNRFGAPAGEPSFHCAVALVEGRVPLPQSSRLTLPV